MANERKITELIYPVRGLDLQTAFGLQRPGTTPCCKNCLGHEPCSGRRRGGRRPGLARLDGRIPAGDTVIQHLSQVVIGSTAGLYDPDFPWDGETDDLPGDPGPPWTWGGGLIVPGWNGQPITGQNTNGGGNQNPLGNKKKRRRGSGIQPNPNQIFLSGGGGAYRLFGCIGQVLINVHTTPVDFFGTTPSFPGCMCVPVDYLMLAGPPTDARHFNNWWCCLQYYFTLHNIPFDGWEMVGTTITGTVTGDPAAMGIRACGLGDDDINGGDASPCADGYSAVDNVDLSGNDQCCSLVLLTASAQYPPTGMLTKTQTYQSCADAF